VFLHPGEEHAKELGWFRLVFSQEEEVLVEGLRRQVAPIPPLSPSSSLDFRWIDIEQQRTRKSISR